MTACEEGQGMCAHMLIVISIILIFLTFPFSLCCVVKVVQVIKISWTTFTGTDIVKVVNNSIQS